MRAIFLLAGMLTAVAASGVEQPTIVSFTVTPHKVRPGEPITLQWEVRGVRSLSLDWAPAVDTRDHWQHRADLPPAGTLVMRPAESMVFVLTCEEGGGLTCASASVSVEMKP
jgi:hypothetical protein